MRKRHKNSKTTARISTRNGKSGEGKRREDLKASRVVGQTEQAGRKRQILNPTNFVIRSARKDHARIEIFLKDRFTDEQKLPFWKFLELKRGKKVNFGAFLEYFGLKLEQIHGIHG